MTVYDERFFEELREGTRSSARAVVPLVMRMLAPASVVDVGCGLGTWLAVFAENGISDFLGIDGSYVDPIRLEIPRERFLPHDLSTPLRLDRRFDLAVSLEVAEHLPVSAAETCVGSLAELAPFVLFSAAIPFQGGTNHVNEQWPEYWADLFEKRGFAPVDCVRGEIWSDRRVEWWYAQNTLLFVSRDRLGKIAATGFELERTPVSRLALVHPRQYLYTVQSERAARRCADNVPNPPATSGEPSR